MAKGNVYWAKDYYQTALETYQQALDLTHKFKTDQHEVFQVMILSNISGIYKKLKENDKALSFAEESINLAYETRNLRPRGHLKFGTTLNELGQYERALDSLRVTKKMIYQHNDSIALVHCLLAIGEAFHHLETYDSALYYTKQSAFVAGLLGYDFIEILIQRGDLYFSQQRKDLALAKYQEALQMAVQQKSIEGQQEIYEKMSMLFEDQKNYQKAHEYLISSFSLKDSISGTAIQNRINELNTKYETEKKQQQITQLEQDNQIIELEAKRQNQFLILLGLVAVLLVLATVLLIRRNRMKTEVNAILDAKNQELAKLNNTKNRLFSIISHDLKSPLSSFHTITKSLSDNWEVLEKEQLKDFIITLRDSSSDVKNMMDNLLKWALAQTGELNYAPQSVSPSEVLTKVKSQMESVTRVKKVNILEEVKSTTTISADQQFLEIILRNLMSNAVKFSKVETDIKVSIASEGNYEVISIQDYGVGMDQTEIDQLLDGSILAQDIQNSTEKGTGLGLTLCKELIAKMGAEMKVLSEKGKGTTFKLVFAKTA
ncbi:tetratricopeptide repeat-containing sensor histidine kinase [Reichenbachiella carrageenanivorans]|uniref:histidine kinase n=1 Tax=Reichenbachiella carrageenanivorans TaxID=2979869 RepID=A0ABY6D4J5_9BACT|nr:tetratricopeptide repeat-containing sensor histidine kinase [Reichenbachiella carrageenanivorans]UXX80829.1 tetratricopeptide repeat-containing sensor histidine kinase [Reichenbachiella carrageenanivorans]